MVGLVGTFYQTPPFFVALDLFMRTAWRHARTERAGSAVISFNISCGSSKTVGIHLCSLFPILSVPCFSPSTAMSDHTWLLHLSESTVDCADSTYQIGANKLRLQSLAFPSSGSRSAVIDFLEKLPRRSQLFLCSLIRSLGLAMSQSKKSEVVIFPQSVRE